MNVELLRKVQAHVLEEPKRVWMNDWIVFGPDYAGLKRPECDTVGCIGGWGWLLSGHTGYPDNVDGYLEVFDITFHEGKRLFHIGHWPDRFKDKLSEFRWQTQEYAQAVSDRIDHFIATEGRE
jgi:hypothetical protein